MVGEAVKAAGAVSQATLYRALLAADPRLSRFNPLPRMLAFDDFDEGANGWCELIGNHDGNLDNISPMLADLRPPQSALQLFDIWTHARCGRTSSDARGRGRTARVRDQVDYGRAGACSGGIVHVQAEGSLGASTCVARGDEVGWQL